MNTLRPALPPQRQTLTAALCLTIWLTVTALFVGLRPEHILMAGLIAALFTYNGTTRRLIVALIPFALFGISYDWMNICPNYHVNHVDIQQLYHSEKALFGITAAGGATVTPNEYFATHHTPWADLLAGIFYLCWVPVPIAFGLWLYYDRQRRQYLHFALVFLFVNLIGFAIYYIHPAAPPWYVQEYGFQFIPGTHGQTAGLGRFDAMTHTAIFDALYARNSNVFAAIPSLHSAYMLIAFIYSLRARTALWWRITAAIICCGIWFTAVYSSHHYIIDVLAGIATALTGILIFELLARHSRPVARLIDRYTRYITPPANTNK